MQVIVSSARIIVNNIRSLLADKNMTQAELSRLSGIVTAQLNAYLSGRNVPGLDKLELLAVALGVSIADLLNGSETPRAAPPRKPSEEEMLGFMLSRFDLEEDRLEAVRLLLTVDPDTLDNCLLILRGAAPAKKNRQSSAG
jgi:transcriptional regulator with XRE-family HTH domain